MRTHGWGGNSPASDEEAIARILSATRRCIDTKGAAATITDVAALLCVTRPTIYRYFASTDDLLRATAIDAAGEFMERLTSHIADIRDPATAIVELVAYTLECLPSERYIGLLLAADRVGTFAPGVTSSTAMAFGHSLIRGVNVDWESAGLDAPLLDEWVEHLLRILQSLLLDPGRPPRTGAGLRQCLARWVLPVPAAALIALPQSSGPSPPGRCTPAVDEDTTSLGT